MAKFLIGDRVRMVPEAPKVRSSDWYDELAGLEGTVLKVPEGFGRYGVKFDTTKHGHDLGGLIKWSVENPQSKGGWNCYEHDLELISSTELQILEDLNYKDLFE